ncbi:choice-of-anchor I family protein [Paenibacillus tepidiphilus]|uniref:choice-of-anchor I family protein n=1 Tax=Paenibacillus tepidiphilus TaxID=2608683 RepID=UPI00123916E9|nr:choice-of-anchor I family protein [Paenibacillus tepidiphilus]
MLATYQAGVQPDMVKYTADGRYILTADEAEPRTLEGDPEGSVTIVDTQTGAITAVKFDQPELIDDLVHIRGAVDPDTKLITGSGAKEDAVRDLEPEFITLADDQKTAYVSLQENNAIAALDIASGKLLWVKGLGFKDLSQPGNALDLKNDSEIQLENVPFYGVYMPDGIAQYTVEGKTYLFTANEGDATEWDSKENASTVGKLKASLNPDSPAAAFLNSTTAYDKVEAMTDMGNDSIYMYGARSFSVWNAATMKQVYDSGSDFERITGEGLPDYFNASNSNTTLDSRSTKKGPEPEYVEIGQVGQRALAFTGLERIGGIMTYDVTNPEQPEFVNYTNSREFTPKNNLNTDTGPEGIEFIPADESPTGLPLVLVANEVGGTVAVYQINVTKLTLDRSALSLTAGGAAATLNVTAEAPSGGTAGTLNWVSSDAEVAAIDPNGKVTPLKAGTVTVSVYSEDGYGAAKADVTVAAATTQPTPTPEPSATPSPAPTAAPGGSTNTGPASAAPSPSATPALTGVTQSGNQVIVPLTGTTDTSGTLVVPVTEAAAQAALQTAAGDSGELVFRIEASGSATGGPVQVQVPAAVWSLLASGSKAKVGFDTPQGKVSFDAAALASVQTGSAGGAVTLTVSSGSGAAYGVIGSRPVRVLRLQAGGQPVSSFGPGSVQVSIPYTAAAGEDGNALAAYYITDGGQPSALPVSSYNAASGQLTFRTKHFSTFGVGYHKLSFGDTAGNFAEASITTLAARGIISGVGADQFAPKGTLSRGDAALLLARLAGADLSAGPAAAFQDVHSADYYSQAVAWAADNGIVNGTGGGMFAPRAQVTREQLAVMLLRLTEQQGWALPQAVSAGGSFADQSAISAYAAEAVAALSQAGIISGRTAASGGVAFAPQSSASRAETAHMLAALLKLVQ